MNYRKFFVKDGWFAQAVTVLCVLLALASCAPEDDFRVPGSEGDDDEYAALQSVKPMQVHSKGKGFPVVIMGDGYSQAEIADGTYDRAMEKARTAMLGIEPMTSLASYLDIYEARVVSSESGITTKKRNTAFGARVVDNHVEVWADSVKIRDYALRAIGSHTNKNEVMIVVILNCKKYAGMTLLKGHGVTDSISSGMSISYIPERCFSGTKDFFVSTLQHEVIGHGIGRLADEYCYYDIKTGSADVKKFHSYQKYGMMLNVHYDDETDNVYDGRVFRVSGASSDEQKLFHIGHHEMHHDDLAYRLANCPQYASEEVKWYQGANTSIYADAYADGAYYARKAFYRSTLESMMNGSYNGDDFNVLSRFIIYARVMKVAGQTSLNIHNSQLLDAFLAFDKVNDSELDVNANVDGSRSSSAKGVGVYGWQVAAPPLAMPRVLME